MKILITSGGTKIAIDRVRHIANMSSGTFGSKIAYEALKAGNAVEFFHANGSKTPFLVHENLADFDYVPGAGRQQFDDLIEKMHTFDREVKLYRPVYKETTYDSFATYLLGLEKLVKDTNPDAIILAAAVSDYGVDNYMDGKIRSKDSDMSIRLKLLPKVISKVRAWAPNSVLVGFKLLVDSTDNELVERAFDSIKTNDCDLVVANDLRDIKNNAHKLIIVRKDGTTATYTTESVHGDKNGLAKAVIKETMKQKRG
jgi:phosphopantothenate-cysteine ligase